MIKKFFISQNSADQSAPQLDRFQRIEKLNAMLLVGWVIKGFQSDSAGSYFLLEKQA